MANTHKKSKKLPKKLVETFMKLGNLLGDDYLQLCKLKSVEPENVLWMQGYKNGSYHVDAEIMWHDCPEVVPFPDSGDTTDLLFAVVAAVSRGQAMRAGVN